MQKRCLNYDLSEAGSQTHCTEDAQANSLCYSEAAQETNNLCYKSGRGDLAPMHTQTHNGFSNMLSSLSTEDTPHTRKRGGNPRTFAIPTPPSLSRRTLR